MTDAEQRLWRAIRLGQLNGLKFRRQYPAGNYILDFVCLAARLVVELDGSQHAEQCAYDAIRTAWLETQGFKVLRFWNNDVMTNLSGVLTVISSEFSGLPPSQPSPCEQGEGAG
jgi:very-short-patch-repair endonuclease